MTARFALSLIVTAVIASITATVTIGVYVFGDVEPPTEPGNYLVIDGSTCEVHVVRALPAETFVLRPSSCTPLVKGLGLSHGAIAITNECGVLTFGPPVYPTDLGAYACVECSVGSHRPATCPFARLNSASLMRWERIE